VHSSNVTGLAHLRRGPLCCSYAKSLQRRES
jgi:hypothetical protein